MIAVRSGALLFFRTIELAAAILDSLRGIDYI
jgi:hypothetical protein